MIWLQCMFIYIGDTLPFFGNVSVIVIGRYKSPAGLLYFIRLFLFDFSGIDDAVKSCRFLLFKAFQLYGLRRVCPPKRPKGACLGLLKGK